MKNQKAFLLALGLAWNGVAFGADIQTNDVQQKALAVLHKTVESLEPKRATPGRTAPPPPAEPTFAATERLYLEGKITAKEFQKYLNEHTVEPSELLKEDAQSRAIELLHQELRKPGSAQPKPTAPPAYEAATKPAPPPALPAPAPAPAAPEPAQPSAVASPEPDQSKFSDVEKKMDELLRLKAAREKAAETNVIPNIATNSAVPPAPKTKRERLDDLLRLVIQGKMTDAEYQDKRSKIVSEPD